MQTRMARLAVIDDIRSVVEMIATKIPWEDHGIEVVGKARDGEEGIAMIEACRPDIVLTDIRMPKLDGLSMTERILQSLPDCKIIILSGYTDFEYARKAVSLGAVDFVKKPFTIQEIVGVALRAKEQWEESERRKSSMAELRKQIEASLPALRQEHLNMLLQYPSSPAKAEELWSFLSLDMPPDNLTVLAVEIDDYESKYSGQSVQEIELVRFSLQNILEETIAAHAQGTLLRETSRRFAAVVRAGSRDLAMVIAEACCANIARFTKFTVSIGVGGQAVSLSDLSESYRQSREALSYHFYSGGNAVLHYDEVPRTGPSQPVYSFKLEETLVFALQSGNRDMVRETAELLVQGLTEQRPPPEPEQAVGTFVVWASVIYRTLLGSLPAEKLAPLEEQVRKIRMSTDGSLGKLAEQLKRLADEGSELMLGERQNESQKIVAKAVDYIRAHIGEELTVNRCAKHVNLSGGYFANLFKRETGSTFNQFVTQERLERAKKQLIRNVPVQDIAAELGYEHRRYFSDVFKKHTGMTPSEFKDYYQQGG
ncbi:response regulator [Paenibacillus soyae]|uniref:Response regulator n=1 Tax=Paenibacillus soyae TaxID=2969249 RepID=A0A9X2MRY4_9BACL|nr:response regulator [Paenibacillus soyae]MCR2805734.1 response regulator [Paenibacillus soyae]